MYYSLSNGKVFLDVAKQIADFSFYDLPEILEIKGTHQQTNSVNCGLVAKSFATSLAFGEDPANASYDSKKLRIYVINCLEEKQMIASLKAHKNVSQNVSPG